jgi:hypothetical protein
VATVDGVYVIGGVVFLMLVLGVGLWALRSQSRQFPKGTKLTESERGAAGWFATKFTWLSGGHG